MCSQKQAVLMLFQQQLQEAAQILIMNKVTTSYRSLKDVWKLLKSKLDVVW